MSPKKDLVRTPQAMHLTVQGARIKDQHKRGIFVLKENYNNLKHNTW